MPGIVVFVLYRPATRYQRGNWVIRRQACVAGVVYPDPEPIACAPTAELCIAGAVDQLAGLQWMPRMPGDDAVIEGVWL